MIVVIDAQAREMLETEARRRRVRETGGPLFGFDDGDTAVLACAYGPGPRAVHRRVSFEPRRATTEAIMAAVRAASEQRYRFMGSWHTHPAGAAIPSQRDTATAAEIAHDPAVRLPRPLVIIQATRPRVRGADLAELAAWRWDPIALRLERALIEMIELEQRWCPIVTLGDRRPSRVRG